MIWSGASTYDHKRWSSNATPCPLRTTLPAPNLWYDACMQTLTIGTRGSELAMIQTQLVIDALTRAHPDLTCETRQITTKGDTDHAPIPNSSVGKTWFTAEIERALVQGEIDLTVHSLKDLPLELPSRAYAAAVLPRDYPRDTLISKSGATLAELPKGAIVGTDSIRRKALLLHSRPDLVMRSIRDNVPVRLQKMEDEDYDAVVLAAAGLARLGMLSRVAEIFDPMVFVPAVGQRTHAVEVYTDREDIQVITKSLMEPETTLATDIECVFARTIGGGCKVPIGCYARFAEAQIHISAMAGALDPLNVQILHATCPPDEAITRAQALAQELLQDSQLRSQLQHHG